MHQHFVNPRAIIEHSIPILLLCSLLLIIQRVIMVHQEKSEMMRCPHLPPEILLHVAKHTTAQEDLWACSLVSRSWYTASVGRLYGNPYLTGRNFELFVRTICPSINPRVQRTALSSLVRILNMRRLGYHASKSLLSRLLGRVKDSLEVFIGPQGPFG